MSKSGGIVQRINTALKGLGIKAPWEITGPVSSPEYMSHLPRAGEYRPHGPASPPVQPIIPQADTNLVYDIKYYTRDTRRSELPGGSKKLEKVAVVARSSDDGVPTGVPAGKPHKFAGEFKPIYDYENNGYTQ